MQDAVISGGRARRNSWVRSRWEEAGGREMRVSGNRGPKMRGWVRREEWGIRTARYGPEGGGRRGPDGGGRLSGRRGCGGWMRHRGRARRECAGRVGSGWNAVHGDESRCEVKVKAAAAGLSEGEEAQAAPKGVGSVLGGLGMYELAGPSPLWVEAGNSVKRLEAAFLRKSEGTKGRGRGARPKKRVGGEGVMMGRKGVENGDEVTRRYVWAGGEARDYSSYSRRKEGGDAAGSDSLGSWRSENDGSGAVARGPGARKDMWREASTGRRVVRKREEDTFSGAMGPGGRG